MEHQRSRTRAEQVRKKDQNGNRKRKRRDSTMMSQAQDSRVTYFVGLLLVCGALVEGRQLSGDGTSASDIMIQMTEQASNPATDLAASTVTEADSGAVQYDGMVAMYAFHSRSEFGTSQEPLVVETSEPTQSPQSPSESASEGEEIMPVEIESPVQISDRIMSLDGLEIPCDSDRVHLMPRAVQEKCHKEVEVLNTEALGGEDSEAGGDGQTD